MPSELRLLWYSYWITYRAIPMSRRTEHINIRATPRERAAWEAAAAADELSLSAWLARRANGDRASTPALRSPAVTAEADRNP